MLDRVIVEASIDHLLVTVFIPTRSVSEGHGIPRSRFGLGCSKRALDFHWLPILQ